MKTSSYMNRNSGRGNRAGGMAPKPVNRLFLLLTGDQWLVAVVVGLMVAAFFCPFYRLVSPWVGGALFLVGVIIVHLRYASRFIMPFPHIVLLIVALQCVLAAWVSYRYPSDTPLFNIGPRLPVYLKYGTLVFMVCAASWGIGLAKLRPSVAVAVPANPGLLRSLDAMLLMGVAGVVLGRAINVTSLGFVFVLLANLRYVGVFGRMLCKGPGWTWRLALVLFLELLLATNEAGFHGLLLWGAWTVALWVTLFKPASWKLAAMFAAALLLIPAIQESKWQLRDQIFVGTSEGKKTLIEKNTLWFSYMGKSLEKLVAGNFDDEFIGNIVMRFNQGWIIDSVMQHVPNEEPYARGKTLKDSFVAALFPRFIMPDKVMTGDKLIMEKYAGVSLNEDTTMGLGFAGEMYANFGYWGSLIGCSLYCLVFALLFRAACVRAFVSPMWWAVVPYIGLMALKAEDDIVGVVNWTVKAFVMMAAICMALPDFRRALFPGRPAHSARRRAGIRERGAGRADETEPKPGI